MECCFDLVGARQHGVAGYEGISWSTDHSYPLNADGNETQIQVFANWPMSHARRVTTDNTKNLEYHVVAAIRKLQTDKTVPRKTHGHTMLKRVTVFCETKRNETK